METDRARPSIGRLRTFAFVAESFRRFAFNLGPLFASAFAPALLATVMSRWTQAVLASAPNDPIPGLLLLLANLALGAAISGYMALVALDLLLGKRHGQRQYLSQTLRHLLPLLVLSTLYYIAVGIGLVLLILPGYYVSARYLPLVPAVVFEDLGWAGLSRARDLTKGYRWPLVGVVLTLTVLFGLGLVVLGPLLAAAVPRVGGGVGFAAELLFATLLTAYGALLTALAYLRLRALKEGATLSEIAATLG